MYRAFTRIGLLATFDSPNLDEVIWRRTHTDEVTWRRSHLDEVIWRRTHLGEMSLSGEEWTRLYLNGFPTAQESAAVVHRNQRHALTTDKQRCFSGRQSREWGGGGGETSSSVSAVCQHHRVLVLNSDAMHSTLIVKSYKTTTSSTQYKHSNVSKQSSHQTTASEYNYM